MRYLTKSRFILACECPTKLFYTRKENEYASTHLENPFLEALADGGFQVGELAKCYYPDGYDIHAPVFDLYDHTWDYGVSPTSEDWVFTDYDEISIDEFVNAITKEEKYI